MQVFGREYPDRVRLTAVRAQDERNNFGATPFGVASRSLRSVVACVLLDTSHALVRERLTSTAYPLRASVKYQISISRVRDSRFGLEGYISRFLMCINIPELASLSTMLRKLARVPLSERFTGRHSRTKFEFASDGFFSGVVASGFWPGCHGRDATPPTFSRRMLQVVSLAKSTSLLRRRGNVESSTVRPSNDFSWASFSVTLVSNGLRSEATLCADSSSVSNASFSSRPARIESTSGITSKSPTINVPAMTISLRCLDSQNLRRACSIMMTLLLSATRSVCQSELQREIGGGTCGTLADAGAFQGDFSDVRHLLQVA